MKNRLPLLLRLFKTSPMSSTLEVNDFVLLMNSRTTSLFLKSPETQKKWISGKYIGKNGLSFLLWPLITFQFQLQAHQAKDYLGKDMLGICRERLQSATMEACMFARSWIRCPAILKFPFFESIQDYIETVINKPDGPDQMDLTDEESEYNDHSYASFNE